MLEVAEPISSSSFVHEGAPGVPCKSLAELVAAKRSGVLGFPMAAWVASRAPERTGKRRGTEGWGRIV